MPQNARENIALDFKGEINLLKHKIKATNADNEAISVYLLPRCSSSSTLINYIPLALLWQTLQLIHISLGSGSCKIYGFSKSSILIYFELDK